MVKVYCTHDTTGVSRYDYSVSRSVTEKLLLQIRPVSQPVGNENSLFLGNRFRSSEGFPPCSVTASRSFRGRGRLAVDRERTPYDRVYSYANDGRCVSTREPACRDSRCGGDSGALDSWPRCVRRGAVCSGVAVCWCRETCKLRGQAERRREG